MAYSERIALIKEIEAARGSQVFTYLTSLRGGVPAQIAEDQVRVFFDHLLLLPARPVEKLDLFLVSNGGNGVVPWRLVSLFREFATSFNVLIPYRAYSAATLIALGADQIVMGPFGEIGPIDPTVSNEFNPKEEGTGRQLGISVEDVKAYINFIKNTVGITHEDELIKAIEILATKVHPLALGNVERFVLQNRMMAKKILKTHMGHEDDDHVITEVVENLASKLYFHGHPINRREAKSDLKLKVAADLPPALETAMWGLYQDYESEFRNTEPFNPTVEFNIQTTMPREPVVAELIHAEIESSRLSSVFKTRRKFALVQTPQGQQLVEELLAQGWNHSLAPQA